METLLMAIAATVGGGLILELILKWLRKPKPVRSPWDDPNWDR